MHEVGAPSGHPLYVPTRLKPAPAAAGDLGTIADTVAGDVVAAESVDRLRWSWMVVGHKWHDGSAQVHLWNRATLEIDLSSQYFRSVPASVRVRFLALRPTPPEPR